MSSAVAPNSASSTWITVSHRVDMPYAASGMKDRPGTAPRASV